MKKKLAIVICMLLFCISSDSTLFVSAGTTKTVNVHPTIWTIHGIYTKSATSKTVTAKNYSGYGEYAYCYGQVRSNLSGEWTEYSIL